MPLHGKKGNQQPMHVGAAEEKQVGKGCCLMGHWAKFGLIWAFVWWTEEQGNGPQLGPLLSLNFRPTRWATMGLVSKKWALVEGNGLRRGKGAE